MTPWSKPVPNWVTWSNFGKLLAVVSGGIAFFFTVRKAWFDRTLLGFTLRATNVDADRDELTNRFFDSAPVVRALQVNVTNNGLRSITVQQLECIFTFLNNEHRQQQSKSIASVDKKIGQGDHCLGFLKVHTSPPIEIVSVCAIDSTGKRWPVPFKKLKRLNALGQQQWK